MNRNSLPGILALVLSAAIGIYLFTERRGASQDFVFIDMVEVYNGFDFKKVRESTLQEENARLIGRVDTLNGVMASGSFSELQKTYARYERDSLVQYFSDLTERYESEVLEQLNKYVGDYGREHKCMMVFGGQGNGNFMYVDSSLNVTQDVIVYINSKYAGHP